MKIHLITKLFLTYVIVKHQVFYVAYLPPLMTKPDAGKGAYTLSQPSWIFKNSPGTQTRAVSI